MFEGHDPYLVALSVGVAILGGHTGFGLAARLRGTPDAGRRVLLASAAGFLAIGIWTMHFVGMLAAPLPAGTSYLILPTVVSFLICVLVVGISLFFVSIGEPTMPRVVSSSVLLCVGIVSMHYVGMHGLSGNFEIKHDPLFAILSLLIATGAAYGGLRAFLARQGGAELIFSAIAFGIAVSGMHYTAMYGTHVVPLSEPPSHRHVMEGLVASQQVLSLVVTLLCFVIASGFLLALVPDPRRKAVPAGDAVNPAPGITMHPGAANSDAPAAAMAPRVNSAAPLGGLGQPRTALSPRLPVEGADGTHFIDAADVRSVRADAHYTQVHDGIRERMCSWSISEAEAHLDPALFMRVHRSHIAAIRHITLVRKEGDGAVIELDGQPPHRVPVSRAKMAEVKARLGMVRRSAHSS